MNDRSVPPVPLNASRQEARAAGAAHGERIGYVRPALENLGAWSVVVGQVELSMAPIFPPPPT